MQETLLIPKHFMNKLIIKLSSLPELRNNGDTMPIIKMLK